MVHSQRNISSIS